jgi:hypothetical protein
MGLRLPRQLAALIVVSAAGLCASCYIPWTQRYYVPSAEGATVANTNCAGYPPFAALFFFGENVQRHHIYVYLDGSTLVAIISPFSDAKITFDPTLIHVVADGEPIPLKAIRYRVGKSGAAPAIEAQGPIDMNTNYLIIEVSLGMSKPLDVVAQLPPITVNGVINKVPNVSFKFKKQTHMVPVIFNC